MKKLEDRMWEYVLLVLCIYLLANAINRIHSGQYFPALLDVLMSAVFRHFWRKQWRKPSNSSTSHVANTCPTSLFSSLLPEHIQGDLREEREERIRTRGLFNAYFWYIYQIFASLWPQLCQMLARMVSKIAK